MLKTQASREELEPAWRKLEVAIAKRRVPALACTVLAAVLLLVICVRSRPLPHYVLVLDSGSTGTRIYAYVWQERPHQLPLLIPIDSSAASNKVPRRQAGDTRAYKRVETEPGLDHYIKDAKGLVEKAIAPLLDWAEEVVPRKRWAETPIFLLATAGLRVLPAEHQDNVLGTVRHILHACPFRFKSAWAKIISGEQEGIYGWVALNYISGYLSPHPFLARQSRSLETDADGALEELAEGQTVHAADEGLKTVGSLDLGGSSLEVTFVPGKLTPETIKANVSILGVQYSLFAQEHHDYGLNNGFERSVSILLDQPEVLKDTTDRSWDAQKASQKADRTGTVDYRSNHQVVTAMEQRRSSGKQEHLLKSGFRRQRHLSADLGQLQPGTQVATSVVETMQDQERGRDSIDDTLKHNSTEAQRRLQELEQSLMAVHHPCLQAGYRAVHRRMVTGLEPEPARVLLVGKPDWAACEKLASLVVNGSRPCPELPCALGKFQPSTSQPMFALTGFHVVYHFFGLDPTASLTQLEAKGRRFCDTDWSAISAGRGAEIHVDHYCFRVPYMIKLLREGLKLGEAQIRIGSGNEAWPLGAVLAEGGRVGAGLDSTVPFLSARLLIVLAATALLLWCILLAFVWNRGSLLQYGSSFERKGSGPGHELQMPKLGSHKSLHSLQKMLPRAFSSTSLQAGGKDVPVPPSPTAVIGGGNFNANVARLSSQSNQRKRVASIEDLKSMR